ncbi:Spo0B domain-containing protein [Bacillaceae bacterium S4-13-58]
MDTEKVIELLRHYRHDWMNQYQLIHGYASMNRLEDVKKKVQEGIEKSREESKLVQLHAPHLALWLISFNWYEEVFRLTYHIEEETSVTTLSKADQELVESLKKIINQLHKYTLTDVLYHGQLHIINTQDVSLHLTIQGTFLECENLVQELLKIKFVNEVQTDNRESLKIILCLEDKKT